MKTRSDVVRIVNRLGSCLALWREYSPLEAYNSIMDYCKRTGSRPAAVTWEVSTGGKLLADGAVVLAVANCWPMEPSSWNGAHNRNGWTFPDYEAHILDKQERLELAEDM